MFEWLTHACLDPALALSGAFTVTERREDRPCFDVKRDFAGHEVRWSGKEQLGAGDQSVLLAVQGLAACQEWKLRPSPKVGTGKTLWESLEADGISQDLMALKCSCRSLAEAAGFGTGGSAIDRVRKSLARLASVIVAESDGEKLSSSRLLAWTEVKGEGLTIAVSPRLTRAAQGGQHIRVSLTERQKLPSEASRVLHAWLSAVVRKGESREFKLDTLVGHVWLGDAVGGTLRSRRSTLRGALNCIGGLALWEVEVTKVTAKVRRLTRPRRVVDGAASGSRRTTGPISAARGALRPFDAPALGTTTLERHPGSANPSAPGESTTQPPPPPGGEKGNLVPAPLFEVPEEQLRRQLGWFSQAGVSRIDLAVRLPAKGWANRPNLSVDEVLNTYAGWCRHENARGADIYLRPARSGAWPVIFLDDVRPQDADAIVSEHPALVVETSAGRCHVWVRTSLPLDEAQRGAAQKAFIASRSSSRPIADPGSTSGEHFGRAAGFRNRKPGRDCWVNLKSDAHLGLPFDTSSLVYGPGVSTNAQVKVRSSSPRAFNASTSARSVNQAVGARDQSESGKDWAFVMERLERGNSPDAVEASLLERSRDRRGDDAARYAAHTVRCAVRHIAERRRKAA